ncbi:MAG: HNH endonuclease [Acidobacteria bacterium]|nr:HNH endonuclease [Acidobacteriota bacterium]
MKAGVHSTTGYVWVRAIGHPRSTNGWIYEHTLVAEKAFGKPLPLKAVVHHVNGNRADNRPCNLAILPDPYYHAALHYRQKVRAAGGNPFTQRICSACKEVKDFDQFTHAKGRTFHCECKSCSRERCRIYARRVRGSR